MFMRQCKTQENTVFPQLLFEQICRVGLVDNKFTPRSHYEVLSTISRFAS